MMILATGNERLLTSRDSRAFSLFEVLIVIAFFAVVVGMVALNFDKLIPAAQHKSSEKILLEAVSDARLQALRSGQPSYLSYEPEAHLFVVNGSPVKATAAAKDISSTEDVVLNVVRKTYPLSEGDVANVQMYRRLDPPVEFGLGRDTYAGAPLSRMSFHPSGVATPAKVLISDFQGQQSEVVIEAFGRTETDGGGNQ